MHFKKNNNNNCLFDITGLSAITRLTGEGEKYSEQLEYKLMI